jgi:hypothetical protein
MEIENFVEPRRTFVLWVRPQTEAETTFEGRLEDVDTGQEGRFQSAEQLIRYLKTWLQKENSNAQAN